jgi:predicted acyltransferase
MGNNTQGNTQQSSQSTVIQQKPERLHSLDVLRGFDMFWITGGEGLIHALGLATGWGIFKTLGDQLHHVKWAGFAAYDLIFPLFMFIVGVAIPYSLMTKIQKGTSSKLIYQRIIRRFIILFIFGIIYNQYWLNDWANPRIASVLGQIAFAYFIASIIFMQTQKLKYIIIWTTGILVGYGILQLFISIPGFGAGQLTPEGSINAWVDQHFLPGLLLDGTFDPEGILNNFSASAITLLGIIAGLILRKNDLTQYRKFMILLITGIVLSIISSLLKDHYPIIKKAWTSTYNLRAGGLSFMLLAVFYLIIDIWKIRKWSFYFKVIGVNAITVYMGTHIIDFEFTVKGLLGGLTMYMGNWGPVLISLSYLALVWVCLYALYKNKIFLKV